MVDRLNLLIFSPTCSLCCGVRVAKGGLVSLTVIIIITSIVELRAFRTIIGATDNIFSLFFNDL